MKPKDEIDIDGLTFDCDCPKCGHESKRTASFIRQYSQYCCPSCGAIVPIVDRREILQALAIGEKVIELAHEIRKPKPAPR
jgi:predicted RNA-binding Zn-ribbon protein involved in translation (DUF1610 family)